MLFHSILQADLDTFALPNFLDLFRIKNAPSFLISLADQFKINKNIFHIISVIILIIIF